jgi:hypothetical protein
MAGGMTPRAWVDALRHLTRLPAMANARHPGGVRRDLLTRETDAPDMGSLTTVRESTRSGMRTQPSTCILPAVW